MRARLVRPEFWHDSKMADLPMPTRLTYIGLWCVADDAGYFAWNPREIGANLYPHMPVGRRDKQVAGDLNRLIDAGRVRVLACERHAVIPTLERHRIAGGNRSEKEKLSHFKESTYTSVQESTERTDKSRSVLVSPSVSESVSPSGRNGANDSKNRPTKREPSSIHDILSRIGKSA